MLTVSNDAFISKSASRVYWFWLPLKYNKYHKRPFWRNPNHLSVAGNYDECTVHEHLTEASLQMNNGVLGYYYAMNSFTGKFCGVLLWQHMTLRSYKEYYVRTGYDNVKICTLNTSEKPINGKIMIRHTRKSTVWDINIFGKIILCELRVRMGWNFLGGTSLAIVHSMHGILSDVVFAKIFVIMDMVMVAYYSVTLYLVMLDCL